jgi:hypothetical protein
LGYIKSDEQEKTRGHLKAPAQAKEAGAEKKGAAAGR